MSTAYIGISGYAYKHWKGAFYPHGLPQRRWLEYASNRFNSIELNGTFYSLKSPSVFEGWAAQVPPERFVFAIKGSRYITHLLKLKNTEQALANFLASGLLALGRLTGPFLWQLPEALHFEAERLDNFLRGLPRCTAEAAALARRHNDLLRRGALVQPAAELPLRHALEVRHPSYLTPEFFEILARHRTAFVQADTAGRFVWADAVTTDFVYVRLHGSQQLYLSRYSDGELDWWAERIRGWIAEGKDVYVYFDNDAHGHAPFDAERLAERVKGGS